MDDKMIIALYNARSEKAISATDEKYGKYCFTVADNILKCEQDSLECVNDTYLAAWDAIPPDCPDCLKAYLARITRNIAFNRYKAQRRDKRGGGEITLVLDETEDFLPSGRNIDEDLEKEELAKTINAFLAGISQRDCDIFVCRYFFAESIDEISRKFSASRSNVQKILSRTRSKLREWLEKEGYSI